MTVRLVALGLCLGLLAAFPARAETFQIVAQDAATGVVMDRDTIRRNGQVVRVMLYVFARNPPDPAVRVHWIVTEEEHDCAARTSRRRVDSMLTANMERLPPETPGFGAARAPTPGTSGERLMNILCSGATGLGPTPSLAAFQGRYGIAAAPAAQPAGTRWFTYGRQDLRPVMVLDMSTRQASGTSASITQFLLATNSTIANGQTYVWTEIRLELDCANHRYRRAILAVRTAGLDRQSRVDEPLSQFEAVNAGSDMQGVENFVCRGVSSPGIKPVADIDAFRVAHLAQFATPTAPAAPASATRPATAPAAGRKTYAYDPRQPQTGRGVYLFDLASRKRAGDVVTVDEVLMLFSPLQQSGGVTVWVRSVDEWDCSGRRLRSRLVDASAEDMAAWRPMYPGFAGWEAMGPDNPRAPFEAMICRDERAGGVTDVADLATFRTTTLARPR